MIKASLASQNLKMINVMLVFEGCSRRHQGKDRLLVQKKILLGTLLKKEVLFILP